MNTIGILIRPTLWTAWWKTWRGVPVVDWMIGAHYFRQGNFRRARDYYLRGLEKHRGHKAYASARLDYAYCLYRLGDWLEAKDELLGVIYSGAKLKEAYRVLGEIEFLTGRPLSAARAYDRGLRCYPDDFSMAMSFCHAAIVAGGPQHLLRKARSRLELLKAKVGLDDPRLDSINTAIAKYELSYGDSAVGEMILARVMASGKCPSEANLLRGERFLEQGRVLHARRLLQRALEKLKNDPRAYAMLARTYLAPGQHAEPSWALQLARTACERSFWQNPEYLQIMVEACEAINDLEAAELFRVRMRMLALSKEISLESLRDIEVQFERLQKVGVAASNK